MSAFRVRSVRTLARSFCSLFTIAAAFCITGAVALASDSQIRGRVVDPDSRPVDHARVVVTGPLGAAADTHTGRDGTFAIHVRPGTYDVVVVHSGFRVDPARVTVAADAAPAEIELRLAVGAVSEDLVVAAAYTELPLSTVPSHVTTVSGDDMRRTQAESVADAVRFAPGMTVAATGGRGGLTTVFARGGESDYTTVLVDGVRTNLFGGLFDFAHLSVADIERVEIVRGPQSALFGSDAIGGVISVVSRGASGLRGDLSVGGGTYGTGTVDAGFGGSLARLELSGSLSHAASDGFTGVAPVPGERVSNDDYARSSGGLRARYATAAGSLTGSFRLGRHDRGNPGPYGSDPNHTYGGIDRVSRERSDNRELSVAGNRRVGDAWQWRSQLTHATTDSDFASPFGPSHSLTSRTNARTLVDATVHPLLSATAGVEYGRERATSTYIVGASGAVVPVERSTVAAFGEARLSTSSRWLVAAGVRVERIERAPLDADPSGFPPRPTLAADTVVSLNPKVSGTYRLRRGTDEGTEWTRIRVNAGTGIRAPDAFEIAFTDNPSLAPERSRSYDVGVEHAMHRGALVFEGVYFDNRYDDLIVAVGRSFASASHFRTDNVSNARARGLEAHATARTTRGLWVGASYTFLASEILAVDGGARVAPPPFSVGDALIRRPRHQASAHATWSLRRASAYIRVLARGRVLDVDPSFGAFGGTLTAPGHTVADIGGSWRLARPLTITARVTNLFDRTYEEVYGYPSLGRQIVVGAHVALAR
ncbi:MAG: TonB-dependent receptor [Vicinamibacterales bacterium]